MSKQVYRYYCRMRPPAPGAIPAEGIVHIGCYDRRVIVHDLPAWGYVEYDRPLSEDEIEDYELFSTPNNPLTY